MNEAVIAALQSRRSVRDFEPKEIPASDLEAILHTAMRAPTGGGLQSYSIIVTQDRERLHQLCEIHMEQNLLKRAAVGVTICADVGRNSRWCGLRGTVPGFLNFWGFLLAMADAWSLAQNIVTAADAYGIASCHSGATFLKALNLIDFFGCPEGVIPVATLALGYPGQNAANAPKRARLPLQTVLHHERYREMTGDEILAQYRDKEADDLSHYGRIHGNRIAGVKHSAEVYTKLKYPKPSMDLFSENFLTALKKQKLL